MWYSWRILDIKDIDKIKNKDVVMEINKKICIFNYKKNQKSNVIKWKLLNDCVTIWKKCKRGKLMSVKQIMDHMTYKRYIQIFQAKKKLSYINSLWIIFKDIVALFTFVPKFHRCHMCNCRERWIVIQPSFKKMKRNLPYEERPLRSWICCFSLLRKNGQNNFSFKNEKLT